VRQRLSGRLQSVDEVPAAWREALTTRLKQLAALDPAEQRRPQSARVDLPGLASGAQVLRMQVTTLPTAEGTEDVVLRLSTPPRLRPLAALGLPAGVMGEFITALNQRGMVLCCGLPGSGLSTLLHAALGHLHRPGLCVWTVETHPEIHQPGVRRLPLAPRVDQAAARALQALKHADADVVMVDAPSDDDALREACALAQTGPLVLLAVHAADAPQAWARLQASGVDLPMLQQVCRGTLVLGAGAHATFVAASPVASAASVKCR
jgi:type II secretory ATPase GspE/PulE/Tfp pilus assembly ATPase PilB-like protein